MTNSPPALQVRLLLASLVALTVGVVACASTQRQVQEMNKGSCQSECEAAHPDSLYDRNQCLDDCAPPAED